MVGWVIIHAGPRTRQGIDSVRGCGCAPVRARAHTRPAHARVRAARVAVCVCARADAPLRPARARTCQAAVRPRTPAGRYWASAVPPSRPRLHTACAALRPAPACAQYRSRTVIAFARQYNQYKGRNNKIEADEGRHGTTRHDTARHGTARHGTARPVI